MNSVSYKERLNRAIPGGAHTYSRGHDQFPENAPQILAGGLGCHVWEPSGRSFLDFSMALRSVALGYAEPRVVEAATAQMSLGNGLSRPSLIELEAAEAVLGHFPGADMVKFAKNGSNVTSAAVRLARAFTGRNMIARPSQQPFFSFDDWFIGSTVMNRGVDRKVLGTTLNFDYGDIATLSALFEENPNNVAAVIIEPTTSLTPCLDVCNGKLTASRSCGSCTNFEGNFLKQVQRLCEANGALLIVDEMITGFRWDLLGASSYFGVTPDLATFGKAASNGFSVAFLCGRRDVMELGGVNHLGEERTFILSSTNGAEMSGLGAFRASLEIYKSEDVISRLWAIAGSYRAGMEDIIATLDMGTFLRVEGPDILPTLSFLNQDGDEDSALKYIYQMEMLEQGIFAPFLSFALPHEDAEVFSNFMDVFNIAVSRIKVLVGDDETLQPLRDKIKPVFRRYN